MRWKAHYKFMCSNRGALFIACMLSVGSGWSQTIAYSPIPFDPVAIALQDEERAQRGELSFYGRSLPIDIGTASHGEWSVDGEMRIWRALIVSAGAQAIELFYDDMVLPDGAALLVRDAQGDPVLGPFTAAQVVNKVFSTPLVHGDRCTLEYQVPVHLHERGGFRVTHVGHAYRDVLDGSCNIDVECSPEGDGWAQAAKGVVRISIVAGGGVGWCSGALVNNVRQDCTPYILSAWHCGAGSSAAQFNQFKFYFGYQRPSCGTGTAPSNSFITGAQLRAYSNDDSGNAGSDFMLLEANADVPSSYQQYWLGWDASSGTSSSADGVCIHHPTGSPKRISTYTQALTTGHWAGSTGLQSHWRVRWAATDNGHGVTESGSSGAPLFRPSANGEPRVISTLSGSIDQLSCANPASTSFFGKMSYHWAQNPNTATQKLRNWLDPDDTGIQQLDGSTSPCTVVASVPDVHDQLLSAHYDPLRRSVLVSGPVAKHGALGWIVDGAGRLVLPLAFGSSSGVVHAFDVPYLTPGLYTVVIQAVGSHATVRFIVSH